MKIAEKVKLEIHVMWWADIEAKKHVGEILSGCEYHHTGYSYEEYILHLGTLKAEEIISKLIGIAGVEIHIGG